MNALVKTTTNTLGNKFLPIVGLATDVINLASSYINLIEQKNINIALSYDLKILNEKINQLSKLIEVGVIEVNLIKKSIYELLELLKIELEFKKIEFDIDRDKEDFFSDLIKKSYQVNKKLYVNTLIQASNFYLKEGV